MNSEWLHIKDGVLVDEAGTPFTVKVYPYDHGYKWVKCLTCAHSIKLNGYYCLKHNTSPEWCDWYKLLLT